MSQNKKKIMKNKPGKKYSYLTTYETTYYLQSLIGAYIFENSTQLVFVGLKLSHTKLRPKHSEGLFLRGQMKS